MDGSPTSRPMYLYDTEFDEYRSKEIKGIQVHCERHWVYRLRHRSFFESEVRAFQHRCYIGFFSDEFYRGRFCWSKKYLG